MVIPQKEIRQFQTGILAWYKKNKRDLPWREVPFGTSLDQKAYRILVSEVMLQQTQVSRVIPKYAAWLQAFPTIADLAKAKTADVLRLWSGLGYNRRALYLQKCAEVLNESRIKNYELREKGDKHYYWPKTIEELKKLPGIGEYTAAALACFAFDQQVAVVDTNIRKVIILLCSGRLQTVMKNKELRIMNKDIIQKKNHNSLFIIPYSKRNEQELSLQDMQQVAQALLPAGRAAEWNQALMDYSSAMLKKEILQSRTKQSKFKGSNRYYRGQIIKILLQKKEMTMEELIKTFQKDTVFMHEIVRGLEKDGFIKEQRGLLQIDSGSSPK